MNDIITKLYTRVEQFCSIPDPSPLSYGETNDLFNEVLRTLYYEENPKNRNRLAQMLSMLRRFSNKQDASSYADLIHGIAFKEHAAGNVNYAEFLFRNGYNSETTWSYKNNFAYILRRNRSDPLNNSEVLSLLLPGVQNREPFSLINMALVFALNLSCPDDWHIADDLFSFMPDNLESSDSWWEDLGKAGETEGFLVHFFLLRHGKIQESSLGSKEDLFLRLSFSISNFPKWLADSLP